MLLGSGSPPSAVHLLFRYMLLREPRIHCKNDAMFVVLCDFMAQFGQMQVTSRQTLLVSQQLPELA